MRRLVWIVALLTLVWACKDDDKKIGPGPGDFYLDLSKYSVLSQDTLTYVKIGVSTNGEFWDVLADSTAPWCEPSMNDTEADRSITLRIAPNPDAGERQAVVKVFGEDDIVKTIEVKQMGTAPTIIYYAADLNRISDDSVVLAIDIQANTTYDVIIPDSCQSWVFWAGTQEGDPVRNYFPIGRNPGEPRNGMIVLKGIEHPEVQVEIPLRQLAYDVEYSPVDPGDIGRTKDLKIKVLSATASSVENRADARVTNLFDASYTTGWHSSWSGANADFPIVLELTLEANQNTLDYIMYYPRSPAGNGTVGKADIYYSTADDPDNFKLFGKYDFLQLPDTKQLPAPEKITAPAKIKWEITSGRGGFGSINEIEAWQLAPVDTVLTDVFTDGTYSALNKGVTYDMISRLQEPFLFNIAKYLLTGDYPVADRVREYHPYRHPDNVQKELKLSWTYGLYDNPTGIWFRAMDEIIVFVGALNEEKVSIRITNPMNGGLQEETFALQEGENRFTCRYGGLAYIDYYTENSAAQPVKLHLASGLVNGLFDVTEHTNADWQNILNRSTYAALDVVGRKMHLLFEVEDWKTIANPVELIEAWDDIVILEQRLMGLEKYPELMPKNRIFGFTDLSPTAGYMYASSYKTGYTKGTIQDIIVASNIRSWAVWGPAHEIGHVNQIKPGMKWIGTTEVTNNIYSLYVQTQFGNPSRLMADNVYTKAFSDLMLPEIAHGEAADVFVKLVPFWQLQLYAESAGLTNDYYSELFRFLRTFPDKTTNGERQLDFVKYTCQILELDLTDFFVAWGFLREVNLSVEDYATEPLAITTAQVGSLKSEIAGYGYPKASPAVAYLTDNNMPYLKNQAAIVTGTASRSNQTVVLSGWQNVMAYKVYYNSEVVYISPNQSFTIPSDYPAASVEIRAVQWDGTEIAVTF